MNIINTNLNFKQMDTRSSTKRIILHHAAAKKCSAEDIHRWHLNNGWSGAGYHFLVRKDGTIYRLRPVEHMHMVQIMIHWEFALKEIIKKK